MDHPPPPAPATRGPVAMTALTLVCPVCATPFPVEAGLQDATARQALKAAISLWPPALATPLFGYLALHRPDKQALRWPKLARLLDELVTLVSAGTVTRHRETRPADRDAWGAGLAEVLKLAAAGSLTLPLQGHGLLTEIVHRQAGQRQAQTQRAAAPLHPSHRDWQPAEAGAGDGAPRKYRYGEAPSPYGPGISPRVSSSGASAEDRSPLRSPPPAALIAPDPPPDPQARRAAGLAAAGTLAQALLGRRGAPPPPAPDPSPLTSPATPNPPQEP